MGIFDKAKDLAGQNADKVNEGIDKAGDMIDEKTGGKSAGVVDKGQEYLKGQVSGGQAPAEGEQPPA